MPDFDGVSGWDHPRKGKPLVFWFACVLLVILYGWVMTDDYNTLQRSQSAYHPDLDQVWSQVGEK